MKYRVFICYKKTTAEDYALSLRMALEEFRISAFLDVRDIPKRFKGTGKWWEYRDQAIRDCETFLMIVTRGFKRSHEIIREITLALDEEKEFMCLRRRNLKTDIPIDLPKKDINLRDFQQIPFETRGELLRSVLDNLIEPKQKMIEKAPAPIKKPLVEEERRFPLVYFNITQIVRNDPRLKRNLPNVGFNMRNWNDSPIMAKVEGKVFLGDKNLGLVTGSRRGGKYIGYYDGNTLWNLNPYAMVFGNFNVPKICAKTDENLRIEVRVTLIDMDERQYELLPVSWTFMRNVNDWFFEPAGGC